MSDKVEIIKKVFSLFSFPEPLEVGHEVGHEDFNRFIFLDYMIDELLEDTGGKVNLSKRIWTAVYMQDVYDYETGPDIDYIELGTSKNFLKALEACAVDYFQRGVHGFLENDYENMYLDEMEAAKKAEAESGG